MSVLISVHELGHTLGGKKLFESLSFGIHEREKLGLIGPNGSGKSTLLKLLAQEYEPDNGNISFRKSTRKVYVSQNDEFEKDQTVSEATTKVLIKNLNIDADEADVLSATYLSIAGFEDLSQSVGVLSGGWLKRLSLAIAFAQEPDLLLLDEPTNHMDWEGILWLEDYLKSFRGSLVLVSHDRELLNSVTNKTFEIHAGFSEGYLSLPVPLDEYFLKRVEKIEQQLQKQATMANKARREVDWLRAGVKARTTKSNSRQKEAHQLLDDLQTLKSKNLISQKKVNFQLDASDRQTKKLFDLKSVNMGYGETVLLEKISMVLGPGQCLGLIGENGSGKSTFLKTVIGELPQVSGTIKTAQDLKIVYFEQKRKDLDLNLNVVQYLGDGADHVTFQGKSLHVAGYAAQFLFTSDRLHTKIEKLSGGEQARLLLAKVLLRPADVLILDEPTNDLDMDTIDLLEEMIANFDGLVMVVSHDRRFLSSVCDRYFGILKNHKWAEYADVKQWINENFNKQENHSKTTQKNSIVNTEKQETDLQSKEVVKLSYMEKKFLSEAEEKILKEESYLEDLSRKLQKAVQGGESSLIQSLSIEISQQQSKVDELYSRWDEIQKKAELAGYRV